MEVGFQSVMVIVGPIVLAAAIIWAIVHNRSSRREIERTEQATRDLYAKQDVDDKVRDAK